MNDSRRKKLAEALAKMQDAKVIIEEVRDEEQESFDNLSEGLQQGDKGQKMEEIVSQLDEAIEACDNADSLVNEAVA